MCGVSTRYSIIDQLAAIMQAMALQTQTLNDMAARMQQLEIVVNQQQQQQQQQQRQQQQQPQQYLGVCLRGREAQHNMHNMEFDYEEEIEHLVETPHICQQINMRSATELMRVQIQNPRLNVKTKYKAFDALQMVDGLDEEARENPSVQNVLKKQIAVSAGF